MEIPGSITLEFQAVRVQLNTEATFAAVSDRLQKLTGRASGAEIAALARSTPDEAAFASEIERRFVGESGFMLFAEINHGNWISRYGIDRRVTRWILGNPLIAITMMRRDITAGLFAPVELLVAENADRRGSTITYVRPSSLIAVGDDSVLLQAALALDEKFEALVAHIAEA
jgi:uncharacterized protein (DUF302 family)